MFLFSSEKVKGVLKIFCTKKIFDFILIQKEDNKFYIKTYNLIINYYHYHFLKPPTIIFFFFLLIISSIGGCLTTSAAKDRCDVIAVVIPVFLLLLLRGGRGHLLGDLPLEVGDGGGAAGDGGCGGHVPLLRGLGGVLGVDLRVGLDHREELLAAVVEGALDVGTGGGAEVLELGLGLVALALEILVPALLGLNSLQGAGVCLDVKVTFKNNILKNNNAYI